MGINSGKQKLPQSLFGQIISLMGDWFNIIATAILTANLTGSGLAVGGLFVIRALAQFFTSPLGGVLADRFDRKKILVWADILRFVIVLGFLLVKTAVDSGATILELMRFQLSNFYPEYPDNVEASAEAVIE